jgi:hypothetical protein
MSSYIQKMGRARYVCSSCSKDFTRMWNATRHKINQHQGMTEIIPLGEFLLRKKNYINFLSSGLSHSKHELRPISGRNTIIEEEDPGEILLNDTLAKLAPKIEELDQLLSQDYAADLIQKLEGSFIIKALASPNPVKKFDETISSIRRGVRSGKMIKQAALYLGVSPMHAEKMLRHLLSSSHRLRTDRFVLKDVFHQNYFSDGVYAFQSASYYYANRATFVG